MNGSSASAVPNRVPLWLAVVAVFVSFVAAALAGTMVGTLVRLVLPGLPPEPNLAVALPSMAASGLCLLAVALAVPLVAQLPQPRALGLRSAPLVTYPAAAVGTVMLGPLADTCMSLMEAWLPEATSGTVRMLHALVEGAPLLLVWPFFALLPGVSEELLFRGVLQRSVKRPALAIAASGVGFALFHVDPHHVAGVLPLGLFLAWVAQRSSTWVTVFAHVANNTFAILAIHSETLDVGYGTGRPMPATWLPASLVFVLVSVIVIVRATPPADDRKPIVS